VAARPVALHVLPEGVFFSNLLAFRLTLAPFSSSDVSVSVRHRRCNAITGARMEGPASTFPGFDEPWQPAGVATVALEALRYPDDSTPSDRHHARIALATAYLHVIKHLAISIIDTRPVGHRQPVYDLYEDIRELVEDLNDVVDAPDPTLDAKITAWCHLMDPDILPPDAPADAYLARNNAARFKAYQGIAELVRNSEGGCPRYAPKPWASKRYHYLGLQDCVRILYPPHGTRVTGWRSGAGRAPAAAGGGSGGSSADSPPKAPAPSRSEGSARKRTSPYMCKDCPGIPLKGHSCPVKKKRREDKARAEVGPVTV